MEKLVTPENLRNFTYINDAICQKPIKGIVMWCMGAGAKDVIAEENSHGEFFAKLGILYIQPYYNPWAWMNSFTRAFVDEIIAAVLKKHNLPDDIPFAVTGSSMGGLSSLVYITHAHRNFVSCTVNATICDPMLYAQCGASIRTFYSALYHEPYDFETAIRSISPIHLVDRMPNIEYHFFHGEVDVGTPYELHAGRLAEALRAKGYPVTTEIMPGLGHAYPPPERFQVFLQYSADAILKQYQ